MTYEYFKETIVQHLARKYRGHLWFSRTFYEGRNILKEKLEQPDEALFELFVDEMKKEGLIISYDRQTIYFSGHFCLSIFQSTDKPEEL